MSTPPPFNPDDPFRPALGSSPDPGPTVPLGKPTPPPPGANPPRIPGLDFTEATPDLYVPGPRAAAAAPPPDDATVRLGAGGVPLPPPMPGQPSGPAPEEGRTVAYNDRMPAGVDPVVGWLVCVDGPERGRDYRLHAGRNFVGRSPQMHVALTGDATVSREKHCVVVYDPRANVFRVAPGESAALTYRNGESVDVPVPLQPYDRVEIGKTTLLFLPLCSDRFTWDASDA